MKNAVPTSQRSLEDIPNPSALVSLQFTHRAAHDLPLLSVFKNVTELDLTGNCFARGLPALHALKFLKRLTLAENGIEELWEMPASLEQLSLAGNRLKELSFPLLQLTKLNTLDLSRNQLSSIQPLASLTGLRCLYISSNRLTTIQGIEHLSSLVELDISNNPIESEAALAALEQNQSISVVLLKDTPYYNQTKNIFDSIREGAFDLDHLEDGIFYRNLDRLKDLKSSRFKRKLRNIKSLMADPSSPGWGSSKRSSCVQSACQSSRVDESFTREEAKMPVVRLELPFLQKDVVCSEPLDSIEQCTQKHRGKPSYSHSQLSVEETTPWRSANFELERSKEQVTSLQTKIQTLEEQLQARPDNQLEALFQDLVSYCLPNDLSADLSFSPVRYSGAVEKIKAIADDRNELKAASDRLRVSYDHSLAIQERLRMKLADIESWRALHSCADFASTKLRKVKLTEQDAVTLKLGEAQHHIKALALENEGLRAELCESTKALIEKLRDLEAENDQLRTRSKESWRNMESTHQDSSIMDVSIVRRLPEDGRVLIDKQVGLYVLRLKEKISRLTAKLQKLREQRNEYRARVHKYTHLMM